MDIFIFFIDFFFFPNNFFMNGLDKGITNVAIFQTLLRKCNCANLKLKISGNLDFC